MILTKQIFDNLINTPFEVNFEKNQTTSCELIEVKAINSETLAEGQSEPFSLIFETPGDVVFDQNTFTVNNAELNEFSLFLVPVGADEKGVRYEAIFT